MTLRAIGECRQPFQLCEVIDALIYFRLRQLLPARAFIRTISEYLDVALVELYREATCLYRKLVFTWMELAEIFVSNATQPSFR